MIFKIHFILGIAIIIFLAKCGDSGDTSGVGQDVLDRTLIEEYLAQNNTNAMAHESGIYYSIVDTVLTGVPAGGNILSIYYVAKILDGKAYDLNTRAEGDDSVKLKQGVNAVYPVGLDIGLGLMKEGETFVFYIPSSLAYGAYAFSSLIPENAVLEIEVKLASVENESDILAAQLTVIDDYVIAEDMDNTVASPLDPVEYLATDQIYYKRMSAGTADDTLRTNDIAYINYIGRDLKGNEFDHRSGENILTYTFGVNAVITGLDDGVSAMERGETALIILPSHKAYGESAFIIPSYRKQDFVDLEIVPQYAAKVAPYEIIVFEISLLNNP